MAEGDLAKRCRQGDRKAQRELYDQTSDRIYRLLLRMTRDHEAALDLSQDTYLRAFGRIGQFNGESSLGTWLYRIAVNEALQFLRRKISLQELPWHGREISLEGDGEKSGARLDLDEALGRMDAEDQTILLLRYQEGLDYRSIAEILDCPPGTVASRLNRARHSLRDLLGGGYMSREEKPLAAHPTSEQGNGSIVGPAVDSVGLKTGSP